MGHGDIFTRATKASISRGSVVFKAEIDRCRKRLDVSCSSYKLSGSAE